MPQDNTAGLLIHLKGLPLSTFRAISRAHGVRAAALFALAGWSRNPTTGTRFGPSQIVAPPPVKPSH